MPSHDPLSHLDDDFLSKLPENFHNHLEKVPASWFLLSERELKSICFSTAKNIRYISEPELKEIAETVTHIPPATEIDDQLRALFALEMELACTQNRRMKAKSVYSDVMHTANFSGKVLSNPKKLMWIITPSGSYQATISLLLKKANDELEKIWDIPSERQICRCHWGCKCYRSNAKITMEQVTTGCACKNGCICPTLPDHKIIELKLKHHERLELRARGSIPQVINQRTLSLNVHKHQELPPPQESLTPTSMEDLDRRIKELEAQTNTPPAALPPPQEQLRVIEVEVSELTPVEPLQ